MLILKAEQTSCLPYFDRLKQNSEKLDVQSHTTIQDQLGKKLFGYIFLLTH